MSRPHVTLPVIEFEVVGVAVGAALVRGALAPLDPSLAALTGALAALALAGWVARRARPLGPLRGAEALALASLTAGALVFLAAPGPVAPLHALLLALAAIPLWWSSAQLGRGVA
jgi:hypothetical protein